MLPASSWEYISKPEVDEQCNQEQPNHLFVLHSVAVKKPAKSYNNFLTSRKQSLNY
jgi:hypothetical protein